MRDPVKVHIEGTYALDESYPDGYSFRRERFDGSMRPRYGLYDGGGFLCYLTSPDRQEESGGVRRPGVPFGMDGRDLLSSDVEAMSERAEANGSAVCYGHVKLYAPYDRNMTADKWKGLVSSVFPTYFLTLGADPGNVDAVFVAHTREGHPPHLHFVFWEREPDRIACRKGHVTHYTPFSEIKKSAGTLSSLTRTRLEALSHGMERESARDAVREVRRAGENREVTRKDVCLDLLKIAGEMYEHYRELGWRPPARRRRETCPEEMREMRKGDFPDTREAQPGPGFLPSPVIPFYPVAGPERGEPSTPYVKIGDALYIDVDLYRSEARKVIEEMSRYDPSVRESDALVRLARARAEVTIWKHGDPSKSDRAQIPERVFKAVQENMVLDCAMDLADTISPYGDELAVGRRKGRSRKIKLDYRRKYEDRFFSDFHERIPEFARLTVRDEELEAEEIVKARSAQLRKEEEERLAEAGRQRAEAERREEDERRQEEQRREEARRREEERRAEMEKRRYLDRGGMSR